MLTDKINTIKNEVAQCAKSCGRSSQEIKILAVTKTHCADVIINSLKNGIEYIAESKVQEAEQKLPLLQGLYKEFHFIGHLQTNKINKLVTLKPTLIHSIDKFVTAEKLNKALKDINSPQDILVEINTSGEVSKNGINPVDLFELLKKIDDLEYVRVKGLMTIGALTTDIPTIQKCFRICREYFEKVKGNTYQHIKMEFLSMGMSSDFRIAIKEGSNIIRLGSIIYGERDYIKRS